MCATLNVSAENTITRTKAEEYNDDTYANRFMSLYADVIENGVKNGYLSKQSGKTIPYHCVETLNVDDTTDYGHETTSKDVSYLVSVSAMKDHIVNQGLTTADNAPSYSSELSSAWNSIESMIPTVQTGFWNKASQGGLSSAYSNEYDEPEDCPSSGEAWNTGVNPIQTYFANTYRSEKGLYLMHWLADVNDWYGFGGSTAGKEDGTITLIDSFERGTNESVWETVPHACVEELKYGNSSQGIKGGIFNTDSSTAKQYSYKSTPVAEDLAIQGVHEAIRWGNSDSDVVTLAGKMGDELRNSFFDKYYKAISVTTTKNSSTTGYESAHYLRGWNTSWGGALDGSWAWQIGNSHVHQAYQNPLSTYALLADTNLNSSIKAQNATTDYKTSLGRQLEFYLWLQSEDGPIAGGATNSLHGRYEDYSTGYTYVSSTGESQLITSTFYDMIYLEHPVYEDTPSNQSISNQVESLQRISELYYEVAQLGDNSGGVTAGGLSVEDACAKIMDRWVEWSLENIKFGSDAVAELDNFSGDSSDAWAIPSSLVWHGQPDTWTGDGNHDNTNLTCDIDSYSQDVGDTATWANGLIYYAAANGVDTDTNKSADELIASDNTAEKALGYAKKLLDCQWNTCRDNIGLTQVETNSSLDRFFNETVYVPTSYHGTMPNGDKIENGATFISIRSSYTNDSSYTKLKSAYDKGSLSSTTWTYHRFAEQCEVLLANGVMASLFPNISLDDDTTTTTTTTEPVVTTTAPVTTTTSKITTTTAPVTTTTHKTTTTTTPVTTTTPKTTTTTTPVTTTTPITTTTTEPTTTTTAETSTTTSTTVTGKDNSMVLGKDGWNFNNLSSVFSNDVRYITNNDKKKMLSKLNNIDKKNVKAILNKNWSGACYGMSLTAILAKEGVFDVSEWDSNATYLSDLPVLTKEDNTAEESLINYYHALQRTQSIQSLITKTLDKSTSENVEKLLSLAETVPYGGTPVFVCYQQGDFAHAVVAYDVENTSTVINKTAYQKCIKVLDPNNSTLEESNDNFCIYVNTNNNNWCIPKYNISSEDGGEFMLIENDLNILDKYSYFNDGNVTYTNNISVGIMESSVMDTFKISKIYKDTDGSINSSSIDDDEIKLFYDFDTSSDDSTDSFKVVLSNVSSGYKFDTLFDEKSNNSQSINLSMMYPDCQISATSSQGKYVNFFPTGDVTLYTNNSDFSLGVVFNSSQQVFDWYDLEVSGDKINQATLSPCENGFILSGDNLVNITVNAEDDNVFATTKFTTTQDKVFIYEIDENTIGIAIDEDGDGEYETSLETFDSSSTSLNEVEPSYTETSTPETSTSESSSSSTSNTGSADTTSNSVGDINGDGEIQATDLLLLKKYLLQMSTLDSDALASADINGDGEIQANDLLLLKKLILQMITLDDIK